MAHLIGYARVSTIEQNPQLQLDALEAAGCQRIFVDHASGALDERPELTKALDYLRPGDTLAVWRFDRLGRSLRHLLELTSSFDAAGVGFRSLTEDIDTTTPGGKLIFHVLAALGEFERDLIRERINAGLAAARARGRVGGRPRALSDEQVRHARALYDAGGSTVAEIARSFGVSRQTLYRSFDATKQAEPADA